MKCPLCGEEWELPPFSFPKDLSPGEGITITERHTCGYPYPRYYGRPGTSEDMAKIWNKDHPNHQIPLDYYDKQAEKINEDD